MFIEKPKDEPMDTTDAQVSLGSDGIIESHPNHTNVEESTTKTRSPTINKTSVEILFFLSNSLIRMNNLDFTRSKDFIFIQSINN